MVDLEALTPMMSIIGWIIVAIQSIWFFLEPIGWHISFKGVVRNWVKWDSKDIAITAMGAAGLAALMWVGDLFPMVPGLPSYTWGWTVFWGFYPAMVLLFGVPGAFATVITHLLHDTWTGALHAWTWDGLTRDVFFMIFWYYWIKHPRKMFTASGMAKHIIGSVVSFELAALGLSAVADTFKLIPYWVAFLAVNNPVAIAGWLFGGFIILGAIITRIMTPLAERYGFLARDRHVPRGKDADKDKG
jgi:hypothetical protein